MLVCVPERKPVDRFPPNSLQTYKLGQNRCTKRGFERSFWKSILFPSAMMMVSRIFAAENINSARSCSELKLGPYERCWLRTSSFVPNLNEIAQQIRQLPCVRNTVNNRSTRVWDHVLCSFRSLESTYPNSSNCSNSLRAVLSLTKI